MKILILGGTGAMGTHLVQNLSWQQGVEIYVTSRNKYNIEGNIKYIQGNAQDYDFLKSILNVKYDVLVDFMVYNTETFKERLNILLEYTKQYVFISSARVYANSKQPIIETTLRLLDQSKDNEYLKTDEYALTKARQENLLIKTGKTNWTIIRPYITYSENRLQLGVMEKEEWLYRALMGRTIVFPLELINKTTTLTYGLDVVNKIISLLGNSQSLGEIYHITTNESYTWKQILELYIDIIKNHRGITPNVKYVKAIQLYESKNYQLIYDREFDRKFDNAKILNISKSDEYFLLKDGLDICIKKIIENSKTLQISWISEAMKDRITGEFTKLSQIHGFKNKTKYLLYRFGIKKI